ncbi:putative ribosomal protein S21 [Lupinus albus]|uniref:Putative ribosomal protein S21 n=1 Tax=Lupinus albus TaxID=3870 RepID=A0A6A4QWH5_LUPAL|nr:putative ribosomal protein S21 [Lupinus albus]
MNSITRNLWSLVRKSGHTVEQLNSGHPQLPQLQQYRGIRVKVLNGNLEQALALMQRKMQSSGIERMIKQEQRFHIKNSEKRVLARKNLERRLRSEDLARKLKAIMLKKVRGL